jgi:hypothetical protein
VIHLDHLVDARGKPHSSHETRPSSSATTPKKFILWLQRGGLGLLSPVSLLQLRSWCIPPEHSRAGTGAAGHGGAVRIPISTACSLIRRLLLLLQCMEGKSRQDDAVPTQDQLDGQKGMTYSYCFILNTRITADCIQTHKQSF